MNKKGFAISIILYSLVFLIISIFYMLLGIVKTRYTVSSGLRESVIEELSSGNSLYTKIAKLGDDSSVNYVQKYNTANGDPVDTLDGIGNKTVYYYTSSTTDNLAGQNGNVIFGNFCWQIVRTTADGGVKLIYNGLKTADNKCPNSNSSRPSTLSFLGEADTARRFNLSGSKIYGAGFEIVSESGTNKFRLKDTNTYYWSDSTADTIIGKYICGNTSTITGNDTSCEVLYYVARYYSNTEAITQKYTIESNPHYSQIGIAPFNSGRDRLSDVGYMYNEGYPVTTWSNSSFTSYQNVISNISAEYNYYYGEKAIWNSSTNMYDLKINDGSGNYITPSSTTQWSSIRNSAKGMYTCRSRNDTSCETVYYIVTNSTGSNMFCMPLSNNESADTKTIVWTTGTGYTENNGVYSLTGTSTASMLLKDWYTNYDNASFKNVYVCDDFTSSTCTNAIYHVSKTTNTTAIYYSSSNNYIFGNSYTYSGGNHIINTNADTTKYHQVWDWYKEYNTINNSHYTCFKTDTNNCGDKIYYVFFTGENVAHFVVLKNGETIDNALQKMVNISNSSTSNINKYDSTIKSLVENWYANNMTSLTSYIDNDTVYCADRSIKEINGWSPTGRTTSNLGFQGSGTVNSLSCTNLTDRFNTNNNIAKLKYPVGLLNNTEQVMMNRYYTHTGQRYWLMSPGIMHIYAASGSYVTNNSGEKNIDWTSKLSGVRPVIVLKPEIEVLEGNGTYNTPYILDVDIST